MAEAGCDLQLGTCGVPYSWAVRINNNGEFIHENEALAADFGVRNGTRGYINMGEADAKTFYDLVVYGDPVTIVNSAGPPLGPSDFVYDWSYTYEQWQQLSAI